MDSGDERPTRWMAMNGGDAARQSKFIESHQIADLKWSYQ